MMKIEYNNVSKKDIVMEQCNWNATAGIPFFSWPSEWYLGGDNTVAIWRIKKLKTPSPC